ncbi:MAG TPA: lipopolysaccharide assembly protein LapA domain-containing protein [Xanthobacteraceae bacterium]|nr:lipopolysaccharide assembly protein LapA domain-containing protein [Xanthobacteraceae bacterium]
MRRLFVWAILLPLAVVILVFAVANRTSVTISFDPFSATAPAYAVTVPLFLVMFVALILGVIVGSFAMLPRQLHWWRAARRAEREAERLRAEMEATRIVGEEPPAVNSLAPFERRIGIG